MSDKQTDPDRIIFPCLIKALFDSGEKDPNVRLFWGVLSDDVEMVKKALDEGADVNGTDKALIKRHYQALTTGKASLLLIENILKIFFNRGNVEQRAEQ
uniref:Ankyrin repeat-containing protein n=1 Tax=Candidatus Kentrum sp. FW TaxID=2126338 RepID=A0A450SPE9_9GAMM|nr:MAG: hypothetical protein BECKFW1821B_GA0114236_102420 [Candidatus Kentron sp. FW]VFJ58629.1 MAG: hypothetical protein BECKFW1821A_GA0114235_108410 [Candidatus Kentron sp. FW]VFJ76089.1 MAG: hypothetical protein BECKFW1821C_GA0114237_10983 [Candidatus Kentron sp. FW]